MSEYRSGFHLRYVKETGYVRRDHTTTSSYETENDERKIVHMLST